MKKITVKMAADIEKANKWNYLGEFTRIVPVPLTDEERLGLGQEISDHLAEIDVLEDKKKSFNDGIKGDIANIEQDLRGKARIYRRGKKDVESKLPCFYDPKTDERIFYNHETGAIEYSEKAQPGDRQLKMA